MCTHNIQNLSLTKKMSPTVNIQHSCSSHLAKSMIFSLYTNNKVKQFTYTTHNTSSTLKDKKGHMTLPSKMTQRFIIWHRTTLLVPSEMHLWPLEKWSYDCLSAHADYSLVTFRHKKYLENGLQTVVSAGKWLGHILLTQPFTPMSSPLCFVNYNNVTLLLRTSVIICIATRGACQVNINFGNFMHFNKEQILSFFWRGQSPTRNDRYFYRLLLQSKYDKWKENIPGTKEIHWYIKH